MQTLPMTRHLFFLIAFFTAGSALCQNVVKVTNINPVRGGSMPGSMIVYSDHIFFDAVGPDNKRHLYKTDGTANGVEQVGTNDLSYSVELRVVNDKLLIRDNGIIWKTDGYTIDQVCPAYSYLREFMEFGNKLFFREAPGKIKYLQIPGYTVHGLNELIQSGFTTFNAFCVYQNKLFFTVPTSATSDQLWISDGTSSGTQLLKDINPGRESKACGFYGYNGKLYFSAESRPNKPNQDFFDLWVTDGTENGTFMLQDLYPRCNFPLEFFRNSQKLFFYANSYYADRAIWSIDNMIVDSLAKMPYHYRPPLLFNNKFFFTRVAGSNEDKIYTFDGTVAGFQQFITYGVCGMAWPMTVFNNKLHFCARSAPLNGCDLWISDGTSAGSYVLKFPNQVQAFPVHFAKSFCEFNNGLYFAANYDGKGPELWRLDHFGTTIDEVEQSRVNILPNPASDKIDLTLPAGGNVVITDIEGRTLISLLTDSRSTIDISKLQPGMYLLRFEETVIKFLKQ